MALRKILRYQDDEVRDGVDAEGDGRLIAFHLLLEAIIRNTGDPRGLFFLSFRQPSRHSGLPT